MLNPFLGAMLMGQCHVGRIFLRVTQCFCNATAHSVSFQGVQVECKWCMCLVLVLRFGIILVFCEKGKRFLYKSHWAKILLWDVAVQTVPFVLVGEALLESKKKNLAAHFYFLMLDRSAFFWRAGKVKICTKEWPIYALDFKAE